MAIVVERERRFNGLEIIERVSIPDGSREDDLRIALRVLREHDPLPPERDRV